MSVSASDQYLLCENDGSSLRDSGASVSGERALQEQVFINTYIWEKLLTVRLFWAGAGQRVAAQGGWSGDRTGAGACVVHVGATQDHRADCSR